MHDFPTHHGSRQGGRGLAPMLIAVLVLAVAIGLYLQAVLYGEAQRQVRPGLPQVSIPVVEGAGSEPAPARGPASLQPLPDAQMRLLVETFAPERKIKENK